MLCCRVFTLVTLYALKMDHSMYWNGTTWCTKVVLAKSICTKMDHHCTKVDMYRKRRSGPPLCTEMDIYRYGPTPLLSIGSVQITWKPEYAGSPHLFPLPHRAHAVAENLRTEGPPHLFFCNSITVNRPVKILCRMRNTECGIRPGILCGITGAECSAICWQ